jgi:hypothetical protein
VIVSVLLISTFGLRISGRLSDEVSLSFFADHLAAIFGISSGDDDVIAAAASGVGQRLEWWTDIYHRLSADLATLLTGLGYGFPLIPFKANGGIQAREPHNSVISVVARSGLIGLSAWVWMQSELFRCWFRCFRRLRHISSDGDMENRLLILLSFLVLVMVGTIGEDNMEKPFFAIPYYFFWGIIVKMSFLQAGCARGTTTIATGTGLPASLTLTAAVPRGPAGFNLVDPQSPRRPPRSTSVGVAPGDKQTSDSGLLR